MPSLRHDERRLICILGLDTVRGKMLYQTRALNALGWSFHVLTMHRNEGSIEEDRSAHIVALRHRVAARTVQVAGYLLRHRRELHHVELYVGGRFAVALALLCRVARVPLLVVERGDLMMCHRQLYPLTTRLSIYGCYAMANQIWFKETYMRRFFEKWRRGRCFFLANAVPVPADAPAPGGRDIKILWVNRIIPERHPDLFASALQRLDAQERAETVVIGFSTEDTEVDRARRLEGLVREALTPLEGVECLEYADPAPYYRRALFFVLPADVVFGNFALLEAMAAGVVPVVFAADGVPQLVEHGVNGYVLDPGGDSLYAGLKIALDTAASDWQVMSRRAHETVQTKHSVENWARELVGLYERLPERRFWREREGVA